MERRKRDALQPTPKTPRIRTATDHRLLWTGGQAMSKSHRETDKLAEIKLAEIKAAISDDPDRWSWQRRFKIKHEYFPILFAEIERLQNDLIATQIQRNEWRAGSKQHLADADELRAEVERLRGAIEAAPHTVACGSWSGAGFLSTIVEHEKCTCWKSKALNRETDK